MKELTMTNLEQCFKEGKERGAKYIAIRVTVPNCNKPETIINPVENFDEKLKYYKGAYNEDLTLKAFNKIRIVDFIIVFNEIALI